MRDQGRWLSAWLLVLCGTLSCLADGNTPRVLVLGPIGPQPPAVKTTDRVGLLVVYTALEPNDNDYEHPRHASYRIYGHKGDLVRAVRNATGFFAQQPETVRLAPGDYTVIAPAENYGTVRLAVVVKGGQTTVAYLDGRRVPGGDALDWVCLPNGNRVGWRADSQRVADPETRSHARLP